MTAIRTKVLGATARRGSRIVAEAGMGRRVTIPFPHEATGEGAHFEAVLALCQKFQWKGKLVAGGMDDGGFTFVFVIPEAPTWIIPLS